MISVAMSTSEYEVASARLRSKGLNVRGNTGSVTKDGITARYKYAEGKLVIEVTDKPFLLPLPMVESQLWAYLEDAAGPSRKP